MVVSIVSKRLYYYHMPHASFSSFLPWCKNEAKKSSRSAPRIGGRRPFVSYQIMRNAAKDVFRYILYDIKPPQLFEERSDTLIVYIGREYGAVREDSLFNFFNKFNFLTNFLNPIFFIIPLCSFSISLSCTHHPIWSYSCIRIFNYDLLYWVCIVFTL